MVYFGNWLTTASGAISIAANGEISGITGFTHAEGYDPVVLGQTVGGLTAGASYLLDFWVTGEGNGGPGGHTGVFGLEIDGDTRHLLLPAGSNSFGLDQRYQVALTADATSMDISFHNWGHTTNLGGFASEIVLDDVILNADARVPEPGLLMLMKKRGLQKMAYSGRFPRCPLHPSASRTVYFGGLIALALMATAAATSIAAPAINAPSIVAKDIKLPRAMAWCAYNLGTTGYNQSVAIAKMLKDRHRVTLRVIPGKNDISRLLPLKVNRVQFVANGVSTYFAQEGTFQFATAKWGPMPIRLVMMSVGLSNQAIAVTAASGITDIRGLRGKRVPWVRGAPAVNISTEALLACGDLSWSDVTRVEFPGYNAMWNGIIDGHVDAAYATTVSGPTRKLEASPDGIHWLPVPHDDTACWERIHDIAPYFTPNMATRGAALSEAHPHEGATYPYPLLVTLASQDADLVYNLVHAIHTGYDDFKNADPGSIGWALERQKLSWVVPFHDAAVDYFGAVGAWTAAHDNHNQQLLARQARLQDAWSHMMKLGISAPEDFHTTWMKLRAVRLREGGFDPVWE